MYDYCRPCGQQPDYMPYMQTMGMPQQYTPMVTMPQDQLEKMYPKIYYMIYPAICSHCNEMGIQPGMAVSPNKEQLDNMVENISANIEANANIKEELEKEENDDRQPFGPFGGFGFGGRRFLRDLVGILLVRELIRRRRPYHYGYPGYPGYYGYPGLY